MATRGRAPEPSNRLPWIALGLGALLIVFGIAAFLLTRRNDVTVSITGTPTALARPASPAIPPTLAAPTLPPSQPTTTPQPSPTAAPVATKPPAPTQPAPTPQPTPTPPPAPTQPAPTQPAPAVAPKPAAVAPSVVAAPPSPAAAPAFTGQVADPGGLGNTRADLDAAYGPPTGETPDKLVVYRKDSIEYRIGFAPDLNGRTALIVEVPPPTDAQPLTMEAAIAAARKLLPRDAQPPSPVPEGNDQFAVQRFTSQSLLAALGAEAFQAAQAPPGQILAIYARDAQGRITRIIVGIGNDPRVLLDRGR